MKKIVIAIATLLITIPAFAEHHHPGIMGIM